VDSDTPPRFTEATKAKMLAELAEIRNDHEDKYHLYNGIYHVIDRGCDFCIHHHTTLPMRSDLLHHLNKKMKHHNAEVKVHNRLHGIIEHMHPKDSLLVHVFYDPKKHVDALRGRHHVYGPELVEESQKHQYGVSVAKDAEKKTEVFDV
jgi:hypothetical protein